MTPESLPFKRRMEICQLKFERRPAPDRFSGRTNLYLLNRNTLLPDLSILNIFVQFISGLEGKWTEELAVVPGRGG